MGENTGWGEVLHSVPGAGRIVPDADGDVARHARESVTAHQTRAQLLAGLEAHTEQRIRPALAAIWRDDMQADDQELRRRAEGGDRYYRIGWFFLAMLLTIAGPILPLQGRNGHVILDRLATGILVAGLLSLAGILLHCAMERETPRRLVYPTGLYIFYALFTAFGISVILMRVAGGEPITRAATFGTVLSGIVAVGYVVLFLVRRRAPTVERRRPSLTDAEVRAAADRALLERLRQARDGNADCDPEVFRREMVAGVEELHARGAVDADDARWMLGRVFGLDAAVDGTGRA